MSSQAFISEFQSQIVQTVAQKFHELGGDVHPIIQKSNGYTLDGWVKEHKYVATAVGGASGFLSSRLSQGWNVVPLVADTIGLLHITNQMCWGIGNILNCDVHPQADVTQIWSRWISEQDSSGKLFAVSGKFSQFANNAINTIENGKDAKATILQLRDSFIDSGELSSNDSFVYGLSFLNAAANSHYYIGKSLGALSTFDSGFNPAYGVIASSAMKTLGRAAARIAAQSGYQFLFRVVSGLGLSLGTKTLATTTSTMSSNKLLQAVLNVTAGAGINLWMVEGLSKAAIAFYSRPLLSLNGPPSDL